MTELGRIAVNMAAHRLIIYHRDDTRQVGQTIGVHGVAKNEESRLSLLEYIVNLKFKQVVLVEE